MKKVTIIVFFYLLNFFFWGGGDGGDEFALARWNTFIKCPPELVNSSEQNGDH